MPSTMLWRVKSNLTYDFRLEIHEDLEDDITIRKQPPVLEPQLSTGNH
jgi:hypothetical protein